VPPWVFSCFFFFFFFLVSYAGPPIKVNAYRLASGGAHASTLYVVVEKNTMSPATAGNDETFSSPPVPSTASSLIIAVCVPLEPWSRITIRAYCVLMLLLGRRSLPVPINKYCCELPILTVAIEAKT